MISFIILDMQDKKGDVEQLKMFYDYIYCLVLVINEQIG